MDCEVWSDEQCLGRVALDEGPLPAGWLHPTVAYSRSIGPILQRACDRLAKGGFHLATEAEAAITADLVQVYSKLRLTTSEGGILPARRIELWDDGRDGTYPFLLAELDEDAGPLATLRPRPTPRSGAAEQPLP